jgi:TetR/AcrR family transcriptional regulator, transcriptional repressor for nem operon
MPRTAKLHSSEILEKAMHFFWENGFGAASIDALVKDIGTTRFSLYQQFGGKEGLYAAVLDHYSDHVVTQAVGYLNDANAGLPGIDRYFDHLISTAHKNDCLARGCLMANTAVEFGNSQSVSLSLANEHHARIAAAMRNALESMTNGKLHKRSIQQQAEFLATFAQGLWLRARAGDDMKTLRKTYKVAIQFIGAKSNESN